MEWPVSAAPGSASPRKRNFILVKFRFVILAADQGSRIGNHPIVIVTLGEPLDFGCAASIIRAKLHRVGRGSKQNENGNWRG
jgi:hypothetical protein